MVPFYQLPTNLVCDDSLATVPLAGSSTLFCCLFLVRALSLPQPPPSFLSSQLPLSRRFPSALPCPLLHTGPGRALSPAQETRPPGLMGPMVHLSPLWPLSGVTLLLLRAAGVAVLVPLSPGCRPGARVGMEEIGDFGVLPLRETFGDSWRQLWL